MLTTNTLSSCRSARARSPRQFDERSHRSRRLPIIFLFTILALAGCATNRLNETPLELITRLAYPDASRFSNEEDFESYRSNLQELYDLWRAQDEERRRRLRSQGMLEEVVVTARRRESTGYDTPESITNNQEIAVDEGDIVKLAGNYLLVLRRGKLYSISLGTSNQGFLTPIDTIDVFKPGFAHEAWYDEILVRGDRIVVTGYAYEDFWEFDATEINLLRISDDGHLSHEDTLLIASDDYYDYENYAARLISDDLTLHIPMPLGDGLPQYALVPPLPERSLTWTPLLDFSRIHRPVQPLAYPYLHVFVRCSLLTRPLNCDGIALIAGQLSTNYVTRNASYLFTLAPTAAAVANQRRAYGYYDYLYDADPEQYDHRVFRLDRATGQVGSITLDGDAPLNHFSFYERGDRLYLATIRDDRGDDEDEYTQRLYQIPIDRFQSSSNTQMADWLPLGAAILYPDHRFTGDWLVSGGYASPINYDSERLRGALLAVNLTSREQFLFELDHAARRLEPIADGLLIAGSTGVSSCGRHLGVTTLNFDPSPWLAGSLLMTELIEAENRSHAFNSGSISGQLIAGLVTQDRALLTPSRWGDCDVDDNSPSDLTFLGVSDSGTLFPVGKFVSTTQTDDADVDDYYSDYDWYGNTRPFFIGDRIFGLSGWEIIEGSYAGGSIGETQRVDIRNTASP